MKAALPPGLPRAVALAASLALAACVPATKAPPRAGPAVPPAAPARPAQPAARPAAAAPLPADPGAGWMDAALTAGNWRYERSAGGPLAVFVGAGGGGDFVMTCERAQGRIALWRAGTSAAPRVMTVRTETATRALQVVQAEDANPYLTTALAATDPLFDAMALSKGRFAIEVEGAAPLYLPSWAEVSRVIEDCR